MNPSIETIIWDLGNVLIKWNPKNLYRTIFDTEEKVDWFLSNICTSDWNEQQDAGRTWEEGTNLLIQQYPEYETQILAYWKRWKETLVGVISGSEKILRTLKAQNTHRLYALTNWSAETFPIARERYDFLQLFEGILVSGEEYLKKPDPKIYQLLLDRYQINPHTSIFIDDSERNVKGAQALGIHAIHFQHPGQLQRDLAGYGVHVDIVI